LTVFISTISLLRTSFYNIARDIIKLPKIRHPAYYRSQRIFLLLATNPENYCAILTSTRVMPTGRVHLRFGLGGCSATDFGRWRHRKWTGGRAFRTLRRSRILDAIRWAHRCRARCAALWLGGCGGGGRANRASLPYDIDAKERRRDIAETHREPRSACAKIEIPESLSGEAWMTTTTRRRAISGLRHAKAAPGPKHHRPARQFRPRSNGTIPTKGSDS
jgi:hypothetical protein